MRCRAEVFSHLSFQKSLDLWLWCISREQSEQSVRDAVVFVCRRTCMDETRRIPFVDQNAKFISAHAQLLSVFSVHVCVGPTYHAFSRERPSRAEAGAARRL